MAEGSLNDTRSGDRNERRFRIRALPSAFFGSIAGIDGSTQFRIDFLVGPRAQIDKDSVSLSRRPDRHLNQTLPSAFHPDRREIG